MKMDQSRNISDSVINNKDSKNSIEVCNPNDNNNISDKSDKVLHNKTSHTRFFQRLYGHLEDDEKNCPKKEENKVNDKRSQILISPTNLSSELSSPSPDINESDSKAQKNLQNFPQSIVNYDIGLPHFSPTILPTHFGNMRPLFGLSPADANHHFAAFCKYSIRE